LREIIIYYKAFSKVTLDLIEDCLRSRLLQGKKRLSNRKAVTSASRDGFTERSATHWSNRFCVSTELFPFWHTRHDRLHRVLNQDRLVNVRSTLRSFFTMMSFRNEGEVDWMPLNVEDLSLTRLMILHHRRAPRGFAILIFLDIKWNKYTNIKVIIIVEL